MKAVNQFSRVLAAVLLLGLLASCGTSPPGNGGPDAFFTGREDYGDDLPEGATVVSVDLFMQLAQQEGFVWDSLARQERLRAEADARFRADEQEVTRLVAQNPPLAWVLEEPDLDDPDIEILPSGEYLITILDNFGNPFQVRTLGKADRYQDFLATRERYLDADNQLTVYSYAYKALPADLQGDFTAPEQLAGASAEAVMEALAAIEARLAENVEPLTALSMKLYLAEHGRVSPLESDLSPQAIDDFRPPGYPASPNDELGAGVGSDRSGTCEFSDLGLYQNFWWPLKYYQTSVKSQGNRGSCVAFALTSALESSIALGSNQWVNLSEQYLYYQIKSSWQPAHYGDGAKTHKMAKQFAESNYRLPLETQWNYNPAPFRVDLVELGIDKHYPNPYANSCIGYNENCSDTTHQGQFVCTTVASSTFCGHYAPTNANNTGHRMPDIDVLWQRSPFGVPHLTTWLLLMQGYPMVVSLDTDTRFNNPTSGAYVTTDTGPKKGGHAVHLVGFIPASYVTGSDLPQWIKDRATDSGGGFFVIKNSWGCNKGDAGYYYVPVTWANQRFKSIILVDRGPIANFFETAPNIEIVAPQDGATVWYGGFGSTFETKVADLQDGPSCCPVSWTSDVDGIIGHGTKIDYAFPTPGTRTITATATDSKGNAASANITLKAINVPPTVSIHAPSQGAILQMGVPAVFQANAYDPNELGGVPCANFTWTSSRAGDPTLDGCTPTATFNSLGARQLTVTATDSYGATDSTSVGITVVEPPDYWVVITEPKDGESFLPGAEVLLLASISSSFAADTPFEWRAYTSASDYTVIASGAVQAGRGGSRFMPSRIWQTGMQHEGTTFDLRVVMDGEVSSAPVTVQFVVIPK